MLGTRKPVPLLKPLPEAFTEVVIQLPLKQDTNTPFKASYCDQLMRSVTALNTLTTPKAVY